MSKIKYLVMGIDNTELSNIIGNLIQGEVQGNAEVLVSPTTIPTVYSVDGVGTVRRVDFDRFLSQAVVNSRRQIALQGPVEKAVQEAVKLNNATKGQSEGTEPKELPQG